MQDVLSGKKKLDVMAKLETEFREKLTAKGWTTEQLDELWALILKQTGYSFRIVTLDGEILSFYLWEQFLINLAHIFQGLSFLWLNQGVC